MKSPSLLFPSLTSIDLSGCRELTSACLAEYLAQATPDLLVSLRLDGCTLIDDTAFKTLGPLRNLEHLMISQTGVTGVTLKSLFKTCTRLQTIEMHALKEGDPSCLETAIRYCRSLAKLDASYWHVSSKEAIVASFKFLESPEFKTVKFTNLQELNFCNWTLMECETIINIIEKCPNLTFLDVSNNHLLDDTFVKAVAENCPKMRKLYMTSLYLITDRAISNLASKCKDLQYLHFPNAKRLTDVSLRALANHCVQLKALEARANPNVSNDGFDRLYFTDHFNLTFF
jgi:Leucine-rich repeat (LRR) protein